MHWFSMSRLERPRRLRHRESNTSSSDNSTPSRKRHLLRRKRRGGGLEDPVTEEQQQKSSGTTVAPPSAPWRIHNILKAPPSADEWWEDVSPSTEDVDIEGSGSSSQSSMEEAHKTALSQESESKQFQNRGYDAWEKARTAWRTPTSVEPRKKPLPVKRETVVRGVTSGKRQYELPGRMTLTDMIGVYQHIWSQQED